MFSRGIIEREITVGLIHKTIFYSIFYSSVSKKLYFKFHTILVTVFNEYQANDFCNTSLRTSENQRFSDVFRGCRKGTSG